MWITTKCLASCWKVEKPKLKESFTFKRTTCFSSVIIKSLRLIERRKLIKDRQTDREGERERERERGEREPFVPSYASLITKHCKEGNCSKENSVVQCRWAGTRGIFRERIHAPTFLAAEITWWRDPLWIQISVFTSHWTLITNGH